MHRGLSFPPPLLVRCDPMDRDGCPVLAVFLRCGDVPVLHGRDGRGEGRGLHLPWPGSLPHPTHPHPRRPRDRKGEGGRGGVDSNRIQPSAWPRAGASDRSRSCCPPSSPWSACHGRWSRPSHVSGGTPRDGPGERPRASESEPKPRHTNVIDRRTHASPKTHAAAETRPGDPRESREKRHRKPRPTQAKNPTRRKKTSNNLTRLLQPKGKDNPTQSKSDPDGRNRTNRRDSNPT